MGKNKASLKILVTLVVSLVFSFFLILQPFNIFNVAKAEDKSVYTLSSPWSYMITHEITVENNTDKDATDIVVKVPIIDKVDYPWQKFLGEEFYPRPARVYIENGDRYAEYKIDLIKAGSKKVLSQKFNVENSAITYNINANALRSYVEEEKYTTLAEYYDFEGRDKEAKKYLNPEPFIESDNSVIKNYAKEVADGHINPYIIARRLYSDINLFMHYVDDPNMEHGALHAVTTGEGNCIDYANLYVACLRSLGIPARLQEGYLYVPSIHNTKEYMDDLGRINATTLLHRVVEFYLPGIGFVVADPTYEYYVGDDKFVEWRRFAGISPDYKFIPLYEVGNEKKDVHFQYNANGGKINVKYAGYISLVSDISPFKDLVGHWAKDNVMSLYYSYNSIMSGIGNDLFGVDLTLTRAELSAIINRMAREESQYVDMTKAKDFYDIDPRNWAYYDILEVSARGLMGGYEDKTFRGNNPVTRGELASVIYEFLGTPKVTKANKFTDLDTNGSKFAKEAISALYSLDLLFGYSETEFKPDKNITRGETAVIIERVMNYIH